MSTNTDRMEDTEWSTVETRVVGQIAAEVRRKDNYATGRPPLYSLRIGRARFASDGTLVISPHISVYDLPRAVELIDELGMKYRSIRDEQRTDVPVDTRRSPRMNLSKDGTLEVAQPVRRLRDGDSDR